MVVLEDFDMRCKRWIAGILTLIGIIVCTASAQAQAPDDARAAAAAVAGSRDNTKTVTWTVDSNEWYPAAKTGCLYLSRMVGKEKLTQSLPHEQHPDFDYLTRVQAKNKIQFNFRDNGEVPRFPMTFLRMRKVISE